MSLQVEVNIVYFPEYRPRPREGEEEVEWTWELKQRFYHQQAEIHMINIGPVTQEILDSKLLDADLGNVAFIWNKNSNEYTWTANSEDGASKPLPLKYVNHLLAELRKVGYQPPDNWYRPDKESPYGQMAVMSKEIWNLEKKF